MKKSSLYRLSEILVPILGDKKLFCLDAGGLGKYLRTKNGKQSLEPTKEVLRKFDAEMMTIGGAPCWRISPKGGGSPGRQILFLHGGGYIAEMYPFYWNVVAKIVSRLGMPLWAPLYPLLPVTDIPGIIAVVQAVYAEMLKTCPAPVLIGDSAGTMMALSLCHKIKAERLPLPMPKKLVLVSPVQITEQDPEILAAMKKIEPHDSMLSCKYTQAMIELFHLDLSPDNYYNAPLYGDFSGFPPMHLFAGGDDIFFPMAAPFAARVRAAGVPCELISKEGMMHVWPYLPLSREAAEGFDEVLRCLAGD